MDLKYDKRDGTSGMSGQLYEINLISLILFRLQKEENLDVMYLASNMDDIGSFDDICFRIHLTGHQHPVLVFIQAKHKENDDTYLNYDLIKHFHASYVKVKQHFYVNKDVFFKGQFEDAECVFILYTNAKYFNDANNVQRDQASNIVPLFNPARKPYQSSFSIKLNQLIATGDVSSQGFQTDFTDKDLEFANEKILEEEVNVLAEHFAKFLNNKANNIMLDKYIVKYHVILAKSVLDISEIKSDEKGQWRHLTFRPDFFFTTNYALTTLKNKICQDIFRDQILRKQKAVSNAETNDNPALTIDESTVDKLIASFLSEPSALTLSTLIGTSIVYKNGKLNFVIKRPNGDVQKLEDINILASTVDEAEEIAARNILLSLKLKVPITFGNLDITLGGSSKKIEKRLNTLTDFITGLCKKTILVDSYETVIIDETVGEGFLSLNNGIGSAIGNLLVYDNVTKFLKFNDNPVSLPNNAKSLYGKLKSKEDHLHSYRFDVRSIMTFPKLSFDYTDEAKAILNKVVIYEKQSNHKGVEAILRNEIEQHQQIHGPHNFPVNFDTVVTEYHKKIQTWWISPKGTYFTEDKNIYQETIKNIVKEPQISAMQTTFYMNNLNYLAYNFNKTATDSFVSLKVNSKAIVVTDIFTLTTIKAIQFYRYDNPYVVLDLECILNLSIKDFAALITELENTNNLVIVVCNSKKNNRTLYKRFDELAQATEEKKVVIITNEEFADTVQEEYFPSANVLNDQKHSLNDFTPDSQKDIIEKTQIIFQDEEVSLNVLVDDVSVELLKGGVLNKIVHHETIKIGKSLSSSSYEEIKHLYIDRKVSQTLKGDDSLLKGDNNELQEEHKDVQLVRTFHDVNDDVVLITATPGMGKSTQLTHLSITTKKLDKALWIVRINLLDHSKVFYDWTVNKTVIDTLETLKFICKALLNNNKIEISLKEINSKVYLDSCIGDEWATFELNMFLHFYNERKLLFLFDGFDEICPFYKDTFITFLNIVKIYPRRHKMWVTSRPYSDILPDLEKALGKAYEIEYINDIEQDIYLNIFWQDKIPRLNFSNDQLLTVFTYIDKLLLSIPSGFLSLWTEHDKVHFNLYRTCRNLLNYLTSLTIQYDDSDAASVSSDPPDKYIQEHREERFLGSPLLLYLVADYFVNLLGRAIYTDEWKGHVRIPEEINIYKVYEGFIDIKLKHILFQDKNKMDVYNPDIMVKYEKERTECYNIHKKIAAHVMLKDSIFNDEYCLAEFEDMRPFNEKDAVEFETVLKRIKTGTEKTGLIAYVTVDNMPVFIHRTFAEYFAAEYICDILKGNKFDDNRKKLLLYGILFFNTKDIFPWLIQEEELNKEPLFVSIATETFGFHHCVALFEHRNWSIKQIIRLMASSPDEDYEDDYLNKWIQSLYEQGDEARDTLIINFINNFVLNMKSHLKVHFTSEGWPVDSAADYSIRYPSTPLRRHLNRIFKEYILFPISCF